MLPVLTRFNGRPEVSPTGQIIYHFPELQVSAQQQQSKSVSAYLKESLWRFSQASSGQIMLAAGLGGAQPSWGAGARQFVTRWHDRLSAWRFGCICRRHLWHFASLWHWLFRYSPSPLFLDSVAQSEALSRAIYRAREERSPSTQATTPSTKNSALPNSLQPLRSLTKKTWRILPSRT